jgi:carbonic anhydrase
MKVMKRTAWKGIVLGSVAALVSAAALASGGGAWISADEALQRLMEGNRRFVNGQMSILKQSDTATRKSLTKGQKPYAVILTCSDSRVPPEVVFDKGLGEIFVIRVAGNGVDPMVLGSIEYAAEHLGSPLIMVLGHERCGAVTAAVEAKGKAEGNLGSIINAISPAVKQAKKEYTGKDKAQLVETAIDDNTRLVAADITRRSSIIRRLAQGGKVKIVAAKYDLDDGAVTVMK